MPLIVSNKFKPEWDKFTESCKDKPEFEVVDYDCGNDADADVKAKCPIAVLLSPVVMAEAAR